MKKTLYLCFTCMLLALAGFAFSAYKAPSEGSSADIYIKTSSGTAVASAKVQPRVCSSISCSGFGKDAYTDKTGYVHLEWGSTCKVCYLYINGKEYSVDIKNGDSKTITL